MAPIAMFILLQERGRGAVCVDNNIISESEPEVVMNGVIRARPLLRSAGSYAASHAVSTKLNNKKEQIHHQHQQSASVSAS
jgi:hypothetical protein